MESHGRRAGFLLRLVNELGLHPRLRVVNSKVASVVLTAPASCLRPHLHPRLRVVNARAEDAVRLPEERERHDIALARAPMPVLAELALPFLRVGGVLAAIKGSRAREEIVSAELAIWELGGGAAEVLALLGDGPRGALGRAGAQGAPHAGAVSPAGGGPAAKAAGEQRLT